MTVQYLQPNAEDATHSGVHRPEIRYRDVLDIHITVHQDLPEDLSRVKSTVGPISLVASLPFVRGTNAARAELM
jgi:hypothetical protein